MGKLRPFVRKDSYMPNKKWIPFVIGNGYTTTDGASGPAPEYETVTGNPVSFNAITPFPLKQLQIAFSPVQDLHGYENPWPAGGGKNKFDVSKIESHTDTYGGIISQSNGTISLTTSTGSSNVRCGKTLGQLAPLLTVGETYIITGDSTATSAKQIYLPAVSTLWKFGDPLTITQEALNSEVAFYASGTNESATITQVMIRLSSVSDATYSPYSNLCPISGWDGVEVWRTGKNLYPATSIQSYAYSWYSHPNFADAVHPIFLKAGTTYVVSGERDPQYSTWFFLVRMFDTQGNNVTDVSKISGGIGTFTYNYVAGGKYFQPSGSGSQMLYQTITPAIDCYVDLCVQANRGEATNAMVEIGSTPSADYVPCNPLSRSISISFGSTLYSGTLDVLTGVVTVDMAAVDMGSLIWRKTGGRVFYVDNLSPAMVDKSLFPVLICSKYPYGGGAGTGTTNKDFEICYNWNTSGSAIVFDSSMAGASAVEFKTAVTGQTLVYPLATPIEIQLTPQEVESLAGDNVLFSDANGDLTVEYRKN